MTILRGLLLVLLSCATGNIWAASLSDIHRDRLPNDPNILKAIDSIKDLELYVQVYESKWGGPSTKEKAQEKLQTAMTKLEDSRKKYPENEELAVLCGLVASYAFNLDGKDSSKIVPEALSAASKLDSTDIRPQWFLGTHDCQTSELAVEGMRILLEVDHAASGNLPDTFWFDEMSCATITMMPAHALRAASHLSRYSHHLVQALLGKNQGNASADKRYGSDQLWLSVPTASGVVYRNYACGMSFTVPIDWHTKLSEIDGGKCAATLTLPPIKGVDGSWTPNIVLIAHVERHGDSFEEYAARLEATRGSNQLDPALISLCPAPTCRTSHSFDAGTYPTEGGGHALFIQFERSQPQQPGLALETPVSSTEQKYTVTDYYARFPGTIYYSILLDSATSILPVARKEFESFMKTVRTD